MSERSNGHNGLAFVLGLLVGALLGGGLGLLFAPGKGEETRKKVKEKSQGLKGKVDDFYQDVKEAAKPILEAVEQIEDEDPEELGGEAKVSPTAGSLMDTTKEKLVSVSSSIGGAKKRFFKNVHR